MLYLFRSYASPISFSFAYVYELLTYTFHIHVLINDFYLYPKYLKPHLMAHCCNFAGRGCLPPPCRPAGGRQEACRPAAGRQGLICKFKKNYLRGSPAHWAAGPLPPTHWAAGGLPPARGAAASLPWTTCCGH